MGIGGLLKGSAVRHCVAPHGTRAVPLPAPPACPGLFGGWPVEHRAVAAAMKQLISSRQLVIPGEVQIEVKARRVRVKGPRGE